MKSSRAKNDTAKLIAAISVRRLAESAGVKLTRKGAALAGSCPFHASKRQTLAITLKTNRWACSVPCCSGENGVAAHNARLLEIDLALKYR